MMRVEREETVLERVWHWLYWHLWRKRYAEKRDQAYRVWLATKHEISMLEVLAKRLDVQALLASGDWERSDHSDFIIRTKTGRAKYWVSGAGT